MFEAAIVIACPTHQKSYLHQCILTKLFKMSVCELNVHLSIWYYFSGWQPCAHCVKMCVPVINSNLKVPFYNMSTYFSITWKLRWVFPLKPLFMINLYLTFKLPWLLKPSKFQPHYHSCNAQESPDHHNQEVWQDLESQ